MATIALYKDNLNGVGGFMDLIINSSTKLDEKLGVLRVALQGVNCDANDLQDAVNKISSSTKTEEEKIDEIKRINNDINDFMTMTVDRENSVRDLVNKKKNEFYKTHYHLKPECEKGILEKICDGVVSVAKWCKKHWKLIVTIAMVVISVALLVTGVGAILSMTCWGTILGAIGGGLMQGFLNLAKGKSFWEGFEDGAFTGAIGGAIGGGIAGALTKLMTSSVLMVVNILKEAFIGAVSTSISNMCVSTLDYLLKHNTLKGGLGEVLTAGAVGLIAGGALGAVMGKIMYSKSIFANKGYNEFSTETLKAIQMNRLYKHLSLSEIKAVRMFTRGGLYRQAQGVLKHNGKNFADEFKPNIPQYKKMTDTMIKALNKSSIPNDMKLFRGTVIKEIEGPLKQILNIPEGESLNMNMFKADTFDINSFNLNGLIGKSFTNKGFSSSSTTSTVAYGFAFDRMNDTHEIGLMLEIDAFEGCNALDITAISLANSENETLFNAGQQFVITNASYDSTSQIITLNVNGIPPYMKVRV